MSSPGKHARLLLALAILGLALVLLVFILFATQNALEVWDRLQQVPRPLFYVYSGLIGLFVLITGWIIYRVLKPARGRPEKTSAAPLDRARLEREIDLAIETGIDTAQLQRELEALDTRRANGSIYVALFGEVSTGKSSIIQALIPDAEVEISARAGSTREISHYTWQSAAGDRLVLSDLPGRNEVAGEMERAIEQEARRAHLVVYVCDSDLSRDQVEDIRLLQEYDKPMIVCVNKSDRLNKDDRQRLEQRLRGQLDTTAGLDLVFVQSGGEEEIIRIDADGEEVLSARLRPARVDDLARAIQARIDQQPEQLNRLRDASVFSLVKQELDAATLAHRRSAGEQIVKSSTRKAIVGALAAISPGSDLVIQGVVGYGMVRSLCKLYDTSARELDIDRFFDFSQGQIRKTTPLLLAVAGNAMKSFPGVGTITGGLTHALAYGLIFDALGKAVHKTLQQRGELAPAPAALSFGDYLRQNMRHPAGEISRLVLEQANNRQS